MNKWLKINTNMEFSTTIPRPTKTNNHNRKEFVSVKKPLCFLDSINRLFHIKICGGVDLVPIFYYLSLSPLASLFLSVVRIKLKKTTTRNKKKKNKNNNNNPKRMSSLNSSGGSRGRGRSSGSERSSGRGSGSGSGSERSSGSGSERSSSSSSSSSVQSAPLINPQEDVPALTKDEEMFEKRESPRKSVDLEAPQQAPSKMGYQVDEEKGGCCKEEVFYFILFYFILFYFILFYFILFYFILFYFILFYFIFFSFIFFYFLFFSFYFFSLFFFILLFFYFFSSFSSSCLFSFFLSFPFFLFRVIAFVQEQVVANVVVGNQTQNPTQQQQDVQLIGLFISVLSHFLSFLSSVSRLVVVFVFVVVNILMKNIWIGSGKG